MRFVQSTALIVAAYTFVGCGDKSNETAPEAEQSNADADADNQVKEVREEGKHLGHTMIQGQLNQCTSNADILTKQLAEQAETLKEQEAKLAEMKKASEECKTQTAKLAKELVEREQELLGEAVYAKREELITRMEEHEAKIVESNRKIAELKAKVEEYRASGNAEEEKKALKTLGTLENALKRRMRGLAHIQADVAAIHTRDVADLTNDEVATIAEANKERTQIVEANKLSIKKELASDASYRVKSKRVIDELKKVQQHKAEFTKVAKEAARTVRVVKFENDSFKIGAQQQVLSSSSGSRKATRVAKQPRAENHFFGGTVW